MPCTPADQRVRAASHSEQDGNETQGGPVVQRKGADEGDGGGGGGKGFLSKAKGALSSAIGAIKDPKGTAYGARLGKEGRQEEVLGDGHDIANQDVILEQLAHQGAYGRLDPRKLAGWGYREMGAAQDPESGFRAVLYVPTEEALAGKTDQAKVIQAIHGGKPPAVLAFRGTAERRGMQDDTNRGGGAYQFASNEARVPDMKQILATIADSDKLTPDQKIKMRDEALRLLGPE